MAKEMKYLLLGILVCFFCACSHDSSPKQQIPNEDNNNVISEENDGEYLYFLEEDDGLDYTEGTLPFPTIMTVTDNHGNIYTIQKDGMGNITINDVHGNFVYGLEDGFGNVTYHDMNGNYYHLFDDGMGNFTMHDMNGNYQYGYDDGMGNVSVHDMEGHFINAHDDGMGNVTVFEPNGDIDMFNYIEW